VLNVQPCAVAIDQRRHFRILPPHPPAAFNVWTSVKHQYARSIGRYALSLFLATGVLGAPSIGHAENAEISRLIRQELKAESRGDFEDAMQACLQILKIDARHIATIATVSGLQGQLGNPAAQIVWARNALAVNPRHMAALVNLGNGQATLGQREDARRSFEMAASVEPRNPLPHYSLGLLADEMGSPRDAIRHYENALRLDPGFEDAAFNLALLRDREKQSPGISVPSKLQR
jgi:tetratricopeptide (TPR) repeat protein